MLVEKCSKSTAKFRFAPSPNGALHIGHAYSAILNANFANQLGGQFQLRIEDIDLNRAKPDYITAIYRDLHWLGLSWPEPVRHQSEHFDGYREAIEKLNQMDLLYPCFATRQDIKKHWQATSNPPKDPDGALLYPNLYKDLSKPRAKSFIDQGKPYSLRLDMPKAIKMAKSLSKKHWQSLQFDQNFKITEQPMKPEIWGDIILARKDIPTSYHLSVVIDDHNQNITHICRGKDLAKATDVHRLLQILLHLNEPLYHHHDLIEFEGQKLSKSRKHPSLYQLRAAGLTSKAIINAAKEGPKALSELIDQQKIN